MALHDHPDPAISGPRGSAGGTDSGHPCRVLTVLAMIAALPGCAEPTPDDELRDCEPAVLHRIAQVTVPRNNAEARAIGLDVNGDATVDNQVGMVSGTVAGLFGTDWSAPSARLASEVTWQLGVRRCAGARFALTVSPGDPGDAVHLIGEDQDGTLVAEGDDGALPVSLLLDPAGTYPEPGWVRGVRAAAQLAEQPGGGWAGKLTLLLPAEVARAAAAPPLAAYLDAHRDELAAAIEEVDGDGDGRVTAAELEASSVMRSLFAPDFPKLGAISFGVAIEAF